MWEPRRRWGAPLQPLQRRCGARVPSIALHPYMVDRMGERLKVARAPWIPAEFGLQQRILMLAHEAAREALLPVVPALAAGGVDLAIIVGLPAARPGLPRALARKVCAELARSVPQEVPVKSTRAISLGHVAGLAAIEEGCRLIREGKAEACLVGGVESYIEHVTIEWIDWTGQLHAAGNPRGFIPGEAAGFCLLVSERAAQKCQLTRLGTVLATATTLEQKLRRDRAVCLGEGLTESFRRTLSGLPDAHTKVDQLIYDFNGQPHRAEEYGFAAMRVGHRFHNPGAFLTPAECWGDVGAASGPLFAILAIHAGKKRYAQGPHTLIWTSAMVAERTSTLVHVDLNGESSVR